jgi:hypothetical protein
MDEVVCICDFLPVGVIKLHFQSEPLGVLNLFDHSFRQLVAKDPDLLAVLHEILSPGHARISVAPAFIIRKDSGKVDMRRDRKFAVDVRDLTVRDRILQILLCVSPIRRTYENLFHNFGFLSPPSVIR